MARIKVACRLTRIPKFGQNQMVYDPEGVSPTVMALHNSGGSTNALIKIIEYEDTKTKNGDSDS